MLGQAADFKDHFSQQSQVYAQSRPTYPAALYDYLAQLTPQHDLCWDVGTGSGQAAVPLAQRYYNVLATDASESQLQHATKAANITYAVSTAESCPMLEDGTVDLVTVAQAVHWFSHDRFYEEVKRVLKPGVGLIAVWTYTLPRVYSLVDAILEEYCFKTVGPYWPPERALVDACYRTLPFPFQDADPNKPGVQRFDSLLHWRVDDVLTYLRSWSATQRYIAAVGSDPLLLIEARLRQAWAAACMEANAAGGSAPVGCSASGSAVSADAGVKRTASLQGGSNESSTAVPAAETPAASSNVGSTQTQPKGVGKCTEDGQQRLLVRYPVYMRVGRP